MASKNFHALELVSSWLSIRHGDAQTPRAGRKTFLCVPCLNRWEQCKPALYANLIHVYPWRGVVTIVVVGFGDGAAELAEIARVCRYPLEAGFLVLCSGGQAGLGEEDAEHLDPQIDNPVLRFWHSSKAKNTAHMAALGLLPPNTDLRNVILGNLDCDNILSSQYLALVQAKFQAEDALPYLLVWARQSDVGTCGRMMYRASDWQSILGYDEDSFGVGYQDIDLKNRFIAKQLEARVPQRVITLKGPSQVGGAIANDPDARRDRNEAKIANIDPAERAQHPRWGQLNSRNMAMMNERTQRGVLVRNLRAEPRARLIGCFVRQLQVHAEGVVPAIAEQAGPAAEALPLADAEHRGAAAALVLEPGPPSGAAAPAVTAKRMPRPGPPAPLAVAPAAALPAAPPALHIITFGLKTLAAVFNVSETFPNIVFFFEGAGVGGFAALHQQQKPRNIKRHLHPTQQS